VSCSLFCSSEGKIFAHGYFAKCHSAMYRSAKNHGTFKDVLLHMIARQRIKDSTCVFYSTDFKGAITFGLLTFALVTFALCSENINSEIEFAIIALSLTTFVLRAFDIVEFVTMAFALRTLL
jgi:hypothetical protein